MILELAKGLEMIQKQGEPRDFVVQEIASFQKSFLDSMDADFDTSRAVEALLELSRRMKPLIHEIKRTEGEHALGFLREADEILGLSGAN